MEEKKSNFLSNFISNTVIVILAVILLLNIFIMYKSIKNKDEVPGVFGYKPFIVMSGSMEKEIRVGDLIFVKVIEPSTLKKGDIVAYRTIKDTVVTHRIVGSTEVEGEKCFEVKGDNNDAVDDELACPSDVEGIYVSRIPKVGEFILLIQEPMGFIAFMMVIAVVCIIIYMRETRKINNKALTDMSKQLDDYKRLLENINDNLNKQ